MKDLIKIIEEKNREKIENILEYITSHPETGGREFQTAEFLIRCFKNNGFDVEENYLGYPTGFKACLRNGNGVRIGFLAKYDAIPKFDEHRQDAHGCGHNWIAALCAGIGIVLKQMKNQFSGEIVVVGAPPEMFYGEKVDILTTDDWKEFDAVFAAHLNDKNVLQSYPLPVNTIEIEFMGKASQAFSYPDKGINALEVALDSIQRIREIPQKSTDRISINICDGGTSTEMIPDYCRLRIAVGALEEKRADQLTRDILRISADEADKIGALVDYRIYNKFKDLQKVPELYRIMESILIEYGEPYDMDPDNIDESRTALDISPVSHLCPMLYMFFGVEGWTPHQPTVQRIGASHSHNAKEKLHKAVQIFSYAALKIMNDKTLQEEIRKSFEENK